MNAVRRIHALVAGAVVCVALLPAAVSAQEATPDRSSPRATFQTFLEAMVRYGKTGADEDLERAVSCLDLSAYAPAVRAEAGGQLARDLKRYLDRVERVDPASIPVEVTGTRWVYRSVDEGEVGMVRTEEGRWLFSRQTLESLPRLLRTVRGKAPVAGVEQGPAGRTFADWLRARMPATLQQEFFLLEGWQWLALLLIAFLGAVLDRLVRAVLGMWLKRLWTKMAPGTETKALSQLVQPAGILVMAFVWSVLIRPLDLPVGALNALVVATRFLMAAAGVWVAYRMVDVVAARLAVMAERTESPLDDLLVPLIRRAVKVVIVAFGVIFTAQNLNINVSSLLAGLGIGGVAFALAAKDTVENLFGSLTVLVDRPFKIGDAIRIGDLEGTVVELGLRSTRIRTFYNSLITVPNSRLVAAAVDNLGERRYRRVKAVIGVQYDTPPEKIEAFCEGIRELIRRHPYTRKDYYMVYFNEFADSSLNVLLYGFFEVPDYATELRERHRLFVAIVRLAHRMGVEFAFPTRTVHLVSPGDGGAQVTPADGAGSGVGGAPDSDLAGDPIRFGRKEAEDLLAGLGERAAQPPPVDFGRPDLMAPMPPGKDPD